MAQVYGVRKHACKHVMIIIPRSLLIPKATAEVMKQIIASGLFPELMDENEARFWFAVDCDCGTYQQTLNLFATSSRPEEPEPKPEPRQEPEEPTTTLKDREDEVGKLVDGLDLPDIDKKDDDEDGE